jgi:hypothetical protein
MADAPRRRDPYSSSQRAAPAFWRKAMKTLDASIGPSQLPQPLVSAGARLATALSVIALVSVAWLSAEDASRHAVQTTTKALTPVIYVTLPTVEITARREPAAAQTLTAASSLRLANEAL